MASCNDAGERTTSQTDVPNKYIRNVPKGQDNSPVKARDPPIDGNCRGGENYHSSEGDEAHDESNAETLPYPRNLDEEVGSLNFLFGGTPSDVVREQVGK